jgi:hypothetical protein
MNEGSPLSNTESSETNNNFWYRAYGIVTVVTSLLVVMNQIITGGMAGGSLATPNYFLLLDIYIWIASIAGVYGGIGLLNYRSWAKRYLRNLHIVSMIALLPLFPLIFIMFAMAVSEPFKNFPATLMMVTLALAWVFGFHVLYTKNIKPLIKKRPFGL